MSCVNDIPKWLRKGELFKNFILDEDTEKINTILMKETSEINNIDEFKHVYKLSNFWLLNKFPLDIFVFYIRNKQNKYDVETFLKSEKSIESNNLLNDLMKNKTILRYKYTIIDEFPETENVLKMVGYEENNMKYKILYTGYTSRFVERDIEYCNRITYSYKFNIKGKLRNGHEFIHYEYDDLIKIKNGDTSKLNKLQGTLLDDMNNWFDKETDDVNNYIDTNNTFDDDYLRYYEIETNKNDISKYRPLFIWDCLGTSFKSEKDKIKYTDGIYIWRMIKLENFIDDILEIIDTYKNVDEKDYNNKLYNGILVLRNNDITTNVIDDFLRNSQFCYIYNGPTIKIVDNEPNYVIYYYDCESD